MRFVLDVLCRRMLMVMMRLRERDSGDGEGRHDKDGERFFQCVVHG